MHFDFATHAYCLNMRAKLRPYQLYVELLSTNNELIKFQFIKFGETSTYITLIIVSYLKHDFISKF